MSKRNNSSAVKILEQGENGKRILAQFLGEFRSLNEKVGKS